jgi:hypothetical protein
MLMSHSTIPLTATLWMESALIMMKTNFIPPLMNKVANTKWITTPRLAAIFLA